MIIDINREAFRRTWTVYHDRLVELENKISSSMKKTDHPDLPKSLRDLASDFKQELEKLGCLTPERANNLGQVATEVGLAESATSNHDVWAALSRAVGCLSRVFLDVNEAFFTDTK